MELPLKPWMAPGCRGNAPGPPAPSEKCNSSARAIRETALRAYCGCRRCFAHILALSSSDYQEPHSYASINPAPDNQMAELLLYIVL